jgi:hypothetical protein
MGLREFPTSGQSNLLLGASGQPLSSLAAQEQLPRPDSEDARKLDKAREGEVRFSGLQALRVLQRASKALSELFLRPTLGDAQFRNARADPVTQGLNFRFQLREACPVHASIKTNLYVTNSGYVQRE